MEIFVKAASKYSVATIFSPTFTSMALLLYLLHSDTHFNYIMVLICISLASTKMKELSCSTYLRSCVAIGNVLFIVWSYSHALISWDIFTLNVLILIHNIWTLCTVHNRFTPHFEQLYLKQFQNSLSRAQFAKICQICCTEQFTSNQQIFERHDKVTKLRYLMDGTIKMNNGSSIEFVHHEDQFVDAYAWMLCDLSHESCRYHGSARAVTNCTCICWSKDLLVKLLVSDGYLANAMHKALDNSIKHQCVQAKIRTQKCYAHRRRMQGIQYDMRDIDALDY
eukprot:41635_1